MKERFRKIKAKAKKFIGGLITAAMSMSILASSAFASDGTTVTQSDLSTLVDSTLAILTSVIGWFFTTVTSNFILFFFFGCTVVFIGIRFVKAIIRAVKK